MSDTITAWHDMQDEEHQAAKEILENVARFIFLLDFTDGKVYMSIMLGILTQNLVNRSYMAQVTK